MRRLIPIFLCLTVLLSGCVQELVFRGDRSIALSVVCADAELVETKATKPGDDYYKENLINSIDYFFYRLSTTDVTGNDPAQFKPADLTAAACLHKREAIAPAWTYSSTPHTYNMIVSLDEINSKLFPETEYVYVLAVANYPDGNALTLPSLKELSELEFTSDFAKMKSDNQSAFLMRGSTVLHLDSRDVYVVNKESAHEIGLERHAAKITVSLSIPKAGVQLDGGTWKPMLQGMEVFLTNGVNTVMLDGSMDADPTQPQNSYFKYKRLSRTFRERTTQTSGQNQYYDTDPMYSYPHEWTCGIEDGNSTEAEPYLKIIVPWYREEVKDGQTLTVPFAQRQCYYKVMLPSSKENTAFKGKIERNNWYHFDVQVTFLGALTDEDAVKIEGNCFIGKWQNENAITHLAEVGTARFLNVENEYIEIHNIEQTQVYYISSNPAQIIDKTTFTTGEYSIDTVRATRLYYGKTAGSEAGVRLNDTTYIHLVVNDNDIYPKGSQYLDYTTAERWVSLGSNDQGTYVYLNHRLNNKYTDKNFDYSPYRITFTLKHKDRKAGEGFEKTVTIIQYPAIYIDCITNSDRSYMTTAQGADSENKTFFVPGSNGTKTPTSTYWGYVFVDGGAYLPKNADGSWSTNANPPTQYKFVNSVKRTVTKPSAFTGDKYLDTEDTEGEPKYNARQWRRNEKSDYYHTLKTDDEKREYQWRTVWYTGGTLDMYRINVSVLFDDRFIIGDPRSTVVNNLNYSFAGGNQLPKRDDFAEAPALYYENDNEKVRSLKYYYPTESSSRTEHMLAPSYRVSSKFSGVEYGGSTFIGDVKKTFAEYRCAAYQEDGFPAGRWRLPTKGEIHFIAQLSANGVFYTLFNDGSTYWSANGPVKISGSNVLDVNTDAALLRCVYDTWYWGADQSEYDEWRKKDPQWLSLPDGNGIGKKNSELRNKFVWGDKPRGINQ